MTGVFSPDDDQRVTSGVTQRQLFDAVQQIQNYIGARADRTEAMFIAHAADDAKAFEGMRTRLTVIETERGAEKSQTIRRATTIGMGTSAGMLSLWKVIDHFWK